MMATHHKTLKKHILLHPADVKRKYHAVKSAILKDKQKYSDRLEGALLDVDNLKIVGDRHLILDGYHSMEVIADFHVFSPKPGQVLDGVINKRSKSHIGCLVLNTFNASLVNPIAEELNPVIGAACSFKVMEVVVDGELMFIKGTLISVGSVAEPVHVKTEHLGCEMETPVLDVHIISSPPFEESINSPSLKQISSLQLEEPTSSQHTSPLKQNSIFIKQEVIDDEGSAPVKKKKRKSDTTSNSIKQEVLDDETDAPILKKKRNSETTSNSIKQEVVDDEMNTPVKKKKRKMDTSSNSIKQETVDDTPIKRKKKKMDDVSPDSSSRSAKKKKKYHDVSP